MNLKEAQTLAEQLIAKHLKGAKHNWKFFFGKTKRCFGRCWYGRRGYWIELSLPLTKMNSVEHVTSTLLHEIAHALDVEQRGFSNHDKNWKKIARSIGHSGNRCYSDDVIRPKSKYTLTCPNCKVQSNKHRYHTDVACGKCCRKYNNGKWTADYILEVKKNY
jgi:predicted SprT family Zn-dependent metalloprotease